MGLTPSRRIPPLIARDVERFWSKVDKTSDPNGCWLWTGWTRGDTGYGFFALMIDTPYGRATITLNAHRVVYFLAHGSIPDGLDVLHSCDHPPCVNPDHLRAGTDAQNAMDKTLRNRHPRGGRVPGVVLPSIALPRRVRPHSVLDRATKISDADVVAMRETYVADGTTAAALARRFGVSKNYALAIITGKSRRQPGGPLSTIRPIVGDRVATSKLTAHAVARMRGMYLTGRFTIYELAVQFSVRAQTVSKIIRGQHWKHVAPVAPETIRAGHKKLLPDQVTMIRQRHAAGVSQRRLARDYRVSPATICLIVNRKVHARDS